MKSKSYCYCTHSTPRRGTAFDAPNYKPFAWSMAFVFVFLIKALLVH